jgi:hypothetical protein
MGASTEHDEPDRLPLHRLRPRIFWNDGGSLVILTHQALGEWQGTDLQSLIEGDSSGSSDYDLVGCIDARGVEGFRVGSGWAVALGSQVSQSAMWLPSENPRLFYVAGLEWAADLQPERLLAIAESVDGWKPVLGLIEVGPSGLLLAHAASTMTDVAELSAMIAPDAADSDIPAEIGGGLRFLPRVGNYSVAARHVWTDVGDSLLLVRFEEA